MPRWASCSLPGLSRYAPVKLPFTWPKSSDSSSVSVSPAQLTAMNGRPARAERTWISRAIRSLPTPLSPVMSTFVSRAATRPTSERMSAICWLALHDRRRALGGRFGRVHRNRSQHVAAHPGPPKLHAPAPRFRRRHVTSEPSPKARAVPRASRAQHGTGLNRAPDRFARDRAETGARTGSCEARQTSGHGQTGITAL